MSDTMRGVGDNSAAMTIAEQLAADNADIMKRAADIEAGLDRYFAAHKKIETDEADAIAANFIGRNGVVNSLLKIADARREIAVEPHLSAQRQVNGWFSALVAELETPKSGDSKVKRLKAMSTAYKVEKEERERAEARRIAEEVRQRAEEAAAAAMRTLDETALDEAAKAAEDATKAAEAASVPAADITRTHGSLGAVSSLRTRWLFSPDESDLMALAKAVVEGKAPLKALAFNDKWIGYAVRSEGLRELAGCMIKQERSV